MSKEHNTNTSRRGFLRQVARGSVSLAVAPALILPKPRPSLIVPKEKSLVDVKHLTIHNLKTGEKIKNCLFWEQGKYNQDALKELNKLLRDHHSGDVHSIDPKLFDLLHALQRKLETSEPFQAVSGYRSPKTNRRLSGAAKNSYHMKGQAIDFFFDGRTNLQVCKAALSQKAGGVGIYKGFVHVDTGPVRQWGRAKRIARTIKV